MQLKKRQLAKKIRIPVILILIILLAASLYGSYYIYRQPPKIDKKIPAYKFAHKGNLTYHAKIKPNMVFKETTLGPGQTIYRKLLESFTARFSYQYEADKPAELQGTYSIIATLEAKDMWKLDFILEPRTGFSKKGEKISLTKERAIDIDYFQEILKQVNEELGVSARDPKLVIKANVNLKAATREGTIEKKLSPTMIIPLTAGVFQVDGELSVDKKGSIDKIVAVTNPIKKKWPYVLTLTIMLVIVLVAFITLTQNKHGIPLARKKEMEFWKKYGERMVKVNDELFPAKVITLNSMDDLVKVADELGKPFVYQEAVPGSPPACYVFDGPIAYRFTRSDDYAKVNYPSHYPSKTESPSLS